MRDCEHERGNGHGCGCGPGMHGRGPGYGPGYGPRWAPRPTNDEQLEDLESYKADLAAELEVLEKRIQGLRSNAE